MNKSIVFRICVLLIIFTCVLHTAAYAYNTHQKAQIATEGEIKGNIVFIRTSVASETIMDKYKKIAGKISNSNDGVWIKGGLVDLPTTSTYQIAYYMFTGAEKNEKGELYNPNPVIIEDNSLEENNYGYVDVGEVDNLEDDRYVTAKLNSNPEFSLDKCVVNNEEKHPPINRYIKDHSGDYVITESFDGVDANKFFGYTVSEMRVITKKDSDGKTYYELQEKIALNAAATDILQEDDNKVYYITPVFYTKGLYTDTPASDSQSIYAEQYFYSYTLNEFFQMKSWASSVRGNDGKGIDSVINQIDNLIEIPARVRTEEIIIKYVKLPDRNMVEKEGYRYELIGDGLKLEGIEIVRYTGEPENLPKEINLKKEVKDAKDKDGTNYFNDGMDEIIGYARRDVNSESELLISKKEQLIPISDEDIEINQENLVLEIIVYSRPKKLNATLTVNHETWHQPNKEKDEIVKMSDYEIPEEEVRIGEGDKPEDDTFPILYNTSTGINGYYEFDVEPDFNTSAMYAIYIKIPIHKKETFVNTTDVWYAETKGVTVIEKNDSYFMLKLTDINASITVRYRVYRGNSPDIYYSGELEADTLGSTSVLCGNPGILSIPNENEDVYLGLNGTLLHYIKGITTEAKWINKSKANIETEKLKSTDDYSIKYTVKIKGVFEDDNTSAEEDTVTFQITDCPSIRLHNITQVAVFSIKEIEYYNPDKDEYGRNLYETVGDKILNLNGNISYTQGFNFGSDDIEINVEDASYFSPKYRITRNHHYYSDSNDWQYPMKFSLLNTAIDFKENLVDIISPYAFTDVNPYARELLEFKYSYKNYDFKACMTDMINNALGIGRHDYWRDSARYKTFNKDLEVNLDFSKLYIIKENGINAKELDEYDTSVSFKSLDKNGDKIINKKDLEIVYKTTNDAYAEYVLNSKTKSELEDIYIAECKFVELYDEAVLMQALAQMFSNLNDIGWIQMSNLTIWAQYTDTWATVTVKDNEITNSNETVDIIHKKNNLEVSHSFYSLFMGDYIHMRPESLYKSRSIL